MGVYCCELAMLFARIRVPVTSAHYESVTDAADRGIGGAGMIKCDPFVTVHAALIAMRQSGRVEVITYYFVLSGQSSHKSVYVIDCATRRLADICGKRKRCFW
jgi:hypothetical protein